MISRRNFGIILLGLALLSAFFVRMHGWESWGVNYDETDTGKKLLALDAAQLTSDYILLKNLTTKGHLDAGALANDIFHSFPTYFVAAKIWMSQGSDNLWKSLREFSLLWSVLTVPVIGLFALRFGRWVAVVAVLLALIHPLLHFYGAYIRFYSLLVFASAIGYAAAVWLLPWLSARSAAKLPITTLQVMALLFMAIVTLAPSTVHLGGAVVSVSLFTLSALYLRFSLHARIYYLATFLLGVVPVAKAVFFLYVRSFGDPGQAVNIMSTSVLHSLLSIVFNFGPGLVLAALAAWFLSLRFKSEGDLSEEETEIRFLSLALMVAIIPTIGLVFVKHSIFRPDYVSGLLPCFIVLTALFLAQFKRPLTGYGHPVVVRVVAGLLIVATVLPTFISTAFIDGDRLDYQEAARVISKMTGGTPAIVASGSPGTFQVNSEEWPQLTHIHLKELDSVNGVSDKPIFLVVKELKGFHTKRIPELFDVAGKVRAVVGSDRLDHRICRLYIMALE